MLETKYNEILGENVLQRCMKSLGLARTKYYFWVLGSRRKLSNLISTVPFVSSNYSGRWEQLKYSTDIDIRDKPSRVIQTLY